MKLNKIVSKFVLGCVVAVTLGLGFAPEAKSQQVFSTNITVGGTSVVFTNAVVLRSIQLLGGSGAPVILKVYDTPYGTTVWTNSAYTTAGSYLTNIMTTNISHLSGYTNIFTNYGQFDYTATIAASTNNALPYTAYAAQINTLANYPVNIVLTRGMTVNVNTNCSLIVTYRDNAGGQ